MAAAGRRLVFAIPGDIETRSGGYGYDRRMMDELRKLGWAVDHLALPSGFPNPDDDDLATTATQLAALEDDSLVLIDGLAFGAMPEIAAAEAKRLRLVALVHHPLALETGLTPEISGKLKESETAALKAVRGVVVTSPATARTLVADFAVEAETIRIAVPGTEPSAPARGRDGRDISEGPLILSVGSLTQRKDHALLIAALSRITDRQWRCRIVGSDVMDPHTAKALRQQIADMGLKERITLTGAIGDVATEYDHADIFALASRYEGYGMVFAEAMARGLPIVGCRGGAIPDLVPESAGMLVEPGDIEGFADCLATLLDNPQVRQDYASGSLVAGQKLPDWPASAAILSDVLEVMR